MPVLPVILSSVSIAARAVESSYPVFACGFVGGAAEGGTAFAVVRASTLACIISGGNANPSTVFLSCVASSESFAMEAAVAEVA
jgi:hypothetical protein